MLYTCVIIIGDVVCAYTGVDVVAYFCCKGFARTSVLRMSIDNVHAFLFHIRMRE